LEKATHRILEELGFVPPIEKVKPLPWKKVCFALILFDDSADHTLENKNKNKNKKQKTVCWKERKRISAPSLLDEPPQELCGENRIVG